MAKLSAHKILRHVRCAYPVLFEPQLNNLNDQYEWSMRICFMRNNPEHMQTVEAIKADMKRLAKANWGPNWEKAYRNALDSKNTRFLRDDPDLDYIFINVKRKKSKGIPPKVVDRNKSVILTAIDGKPKSGDIVNVIIDIFTYENTAQGWSADLIGVQFWEEGEPFGGSTRTARDDEFEDDLSDTGDQPWDNEELP